MSRLNRFLIFGQVYIALAVQDSRDLFYRPRLCSQFPACSGLEGVCCPTLGGNYLSCCDGSTEPSESCTDNPACDALGLTGLCCPTAEGVNLDCCSVSSDTGSTGGSQCSAHAACSNLDGECCPTQDGVFLSCCFAEAALPVAACDAYPACQAAGLDGLCCATAEGVYLECCDGLAQEATQCSAHSACSGLLGECCPTADGVFLECCNGETQNRECSANSACVAIGLEGNCCPPDFGSNNLDCCHGSQSVASPSIGQLCSENSACAAIGLEGVCCPTVHGVELHCCDSIASSETEVSPPVSPPITMRYVTGIPITTPRPSSLAVSALNEEVANGDSNMQYSLRSDHTESSQISEEIVDSRTSVNQLVGQQTSSASSTSKAIQLGLAIMIVITFKSL